MSDLLESGHGSAIYEHTPWRIGMSPASAAEAALKFNPSRPPRHLQVGEPWFCTLAFGRHEHHTPTYGYEPTRQATMAAFAKSYRRDEGVDRPAGGSIQNDSGLPQGPAHLDLAG